MVRADGETCTYIRLQTTLKNIHVRLRSRSEPEHIRVIGSRLTTVPQLVKMLCIYTVDHFLLV